MLNSIRCSHDCEDGINTPITIHGRLRYIDVISPHMTTIDIWWCCWRHSVHTTEYILKKNKQKTHLYRERMLYKGVCTLLKLRVYVTIIICQLKTGRHINGCYMTCLYNHEVPLHCLDLILLFSFQKIWILSVHSALGYDWLILCFLISRSIVWPGHSPWKSCVINLNLNNWLGLISFSLAIFLRSSLLAYVSRLCFITFLPISI